jgi:hypothetical protein
MMGAVAGRHRQWPMLRASLLAASILPLLVGLRMVVEPAAGERLASEIEPRWYRAAYQPPDALTARPGERLTVPVRMSNTGPWTWHATGRHRFGLGYHVTRADGRPVSHDGPPTPLPADVPPGGAVVVEWDGAQEAVTWFSWRGTPPARSSLTVTGAWAAQFEAPASAPPADSGFLIPPPGRAKLWQTVFAILRDRPLLGVGPGNFSRVYAAYAGMARRDLGYPAESLYREWLADTGVVGFLAYLWLAGGLARAVAPSLPGSAPAGAAGSSWVWRVALAASLTTWFVHGFFGFFSVFPPEAVFGLIAGLALAAAEPGALRVGRHAPTAMVRAQERHGPSGAAVHRA